MRKIAAAEALGEMYLCAKADRGWKDTVAVQPGERVEVQPWFGPYAGRYVFHCHNLEHGDKAMMLQLEVVE